MNSLFIGEFKGQEENKSSSNGQFLKSAKISKTKEPQWGRWPSSSSGHVAGNVFIGMAILKSSSIKILSQALAFQRRKNQPSQPTLHDSFALVPSTTLPGACVCVWRGGARMHVMGERGEVERAGSL